jgi:hypothetical protein
VAFELRRTKRSRRAGRISHAELGANAGAFFARTVIAATATRLHATPAQLQKPIIAKLKMNRQVPMEQVPLHGGGSA